MDKLKEILKSPLLRKMIIGAAVAGAGYYAGPGAAELAGQLINALLGG